MGIPPNADTCPQCRSDLTPVGRLRGLPHKLFGAAVISLGGYAVYLATYAIDREEWIVVLVCGVSALVFLGAGLWLISRAGMER